MIANAPTPTFHTITGINYTVTHTAQGWQLTVWEEATVTEQRICPFLWKLRLELPTIQEVNSTLQAIVGEAEPEIASNINFSSRALCTL